MRIFTLLMALITSVVYAQTPSISNISLAPNWTKIAQAPVDTARWMHFPRAIALDYDNGTQIVKRVLLNWQTNADKVMFPMSHGWAGSNNYGSTWNAPAPTHTAGANDFDMMASIKRNTDGVVVAFPFYFNITGGNPQPPFNFTYHSSTNNGTSWTKHTAGSKIVGFPDSTQWVAGFRFHRGLIQDANGDIYAPAIGQWYVGGAFQKNRVMLMKSTNGGVTWNFVNTIKYTPGYNYGETSIVRCKDGSMLAVMRNDESGTSLKYTRSTNNGASWSAIATLPGIPSNFGVDPILELLPNGILVLSYGNNVTGNMRHALVAFSADGNGNSWTNVTQTYTSSTTGLGNKSSGYTSVFPTRTNGFTQLTDRGLYTYYSSTVQHPTPNPFSIWSMPIEVVLNHRNRIDLKTKYPAGQVTVTTDLTYVKTAHPEARISGAFDGSTEYWSGAFKNATTGTYTIDLLQNHTLNGLAVCLMRGRSQTATIQYMPDGGSTWTTMKSYNNAVHHTVDYTTLTPISARYIKVNLTAGTGATMVGINELQLFSSVETFEDYAVGKGPVGYTLSPSKGFWVSEGVVVPLTGYQSKRALYMEDIDTDNREISKTSYSASATKTFEFKLRTIAFGSGGSIQFRLVSGTTNVFRFAVFPNGSVKYYTTAWQNLGTTTPVPLNTWKSIKVVANASTNTASVYVDGTLLGNATKQTASATSINGFLFASGGSSGTGDKALFDDINLYTTGSLTLMGAKSDEPVLILAESNENSLNSDNAVKFSVSVSPNPASSIARLDVVHPSNESLLVRILDMNGREVKKINYTVSGTKSSLDLPISGLSPGLYIIQTKQGVNIASTKLIIN